MQPEERDNDVQAVILPAGHKVRLAGTSYEVTEDAAVPGRLSPVKAQTNRYFKVSCQNPDCVDTLRARGFGPYSVRASRQTLRVGLPICGQCQSVMTPDGWDPEVLTGNGNGNGTPEE